MSVTRRALVIAGFEIYWYAVLIVLGAVSAFVVCEKRQKLLGLKPDTAIDLALVCLPCGIIGARAYYVLFNPGAFSCVWDVLDLRSGGLAIYGGLLTGLAGGLIYARLRHESFLRLCDMVLPAVALAQALGRWGNFLNEEAYGIEIRTSRLRFFPVAVYISESGSWHAATFFYESLWCLFIFLLICVLPSRKAFTAKGNGTLAYLCLYAFERTATEGLRLDSLYLAGNIRASQLLSALVLCGCCVYLLKCATVPLKAAAFAAGGALILSALCLFPQAVLYISLPLVGTLALIGFVRRVRRQSEEM